MHLSGNVLIGEATIFMFWCMIASTAHLQWSGPVSVDSLADALLWLCVYTFPALPQDHINLHINQQSYDEGYIEGHDRGVHHKGRIGNHTEGLITGGCGDKNMRWIKSSDYILRFGQKKKLSLAWTRVCSLILIIWNIHGGFFVCFAHLHPVVTPYESCLRALILISLIQGVALQFVLVPRSIDYIILIIHSLW